MKTMQMKFTAIVLFAIPGLLLMILKAPPAKGAGTLIDDQVATEYKAKCSVCHAPAAAKFYDPGKPDEHHVQVILKGKKGEKPPFMPGFEAKGMTEDGAKALAAYMRSLRAAK